MSGIVRIAADDRSLCQLRRMLTSLLVFGSTMTGWPIGRFLSYRFLKMLANRAILLAFRFILTHLSSAPQRSFITASAGYDTLNVSPHFRCLLIDSAKAHIMIAAQDSSTSTSWRTQITHPWWQIHPWIIIHTSESENAVVYSRDVNFMKRAHWRTTTAFYLFPRLKYWIHVAVAVPGICYQ